ncbi:MAG: hypothetical protein RIR50_314 [Pseudomonadota bacterium]
MTIGPKAFEVGGEVREAFIKQDVKSDLAFKPSQNDGKYFADIYQLARLRLHGVGVDLINGGQACTYQEQQFFKNCKRVFIRQKPCLKTDNKVDL